MSIELVMPSNHLIFCHTLVFLPSIFARIRVFSNESFLCIRWPNYWSFSISPSNEYSGLISFRMDWLDVLAVQRTLKSFLQHHISKASILWHSVFFMVQLSHPYITTGKTIALTRWTFVGKVMSLLLNWTFSRLNISKFSYYLVMFSPHLSVWVILSTELTFPLYTMLDIQQKSHIFYRMKNIRIKPFMNTFFFNLRSKWRFFRDASYEKTTTSLFLTLDFLITSLFHLPCPELHL